MKGKHKKFSSPMVSQYNLDTFVYGGDNEELAERMFERKKPFASISGGEDDWEDVLQLYNFLKKQPHLVVSPLWAWVTEYRGSGRKDRSLGFTVAQTGTLDDNFNMSALAAFYREYVSPEVAEDVLRKRHLTISSYLEDWDWQDRSAKYTGGIIRMPWSKQRRPPVEPWETGLILGYPPEDTVVNYYREGYVYNPRAPEKTVKDYVKIKEAQDEEEGVTYPSVSERQRSEKISYRVIKT
jgi:hypothetical protein